MKPNEEKEATPHVPGSGMYRAAGWGYHRTADTCLRDEKSSRLRLLLHCVGIILLTPAKCSERDYNGRCADVQTEDSVLGLLPGFRHAGRWHSKGIAVIGEIPNPGISILDVPQDRRFLVRRDVVRLRNGIAIGRKNAGPEDGHYPFGRVGLIDHCSHIRTAGASRIRRVEFLLRPPTTRRHAQKK